MTHAIADGSYAVSPVYALAPELTNVGMISAVFKEALDQLSVQPNAEVCYWRPRTPRWLTTCCGMPASNVPRTCSSLAARYNTYRAPVQKVLSTLSLDKTSTPELLAHAIDAAALREQALFHQTIHVGSMAEWIVPRACARS